MYDQQQKVNTLLGDAQNDIKVFLLWSIFWIQSRPKHKYFFFKYIKKATCPPPLFGLGRLSEVGSQLNIPLTSLKEATTKKIKGLKSVCWRKKITSKKFRNSLRGKEEIYDSSFYGFHKEHTQLQCHIKQHKHNYNAIYNNTHTTTMPYTTTQIQLQCHTHTRTTTHTQLQCHIQQHKHNYNAIYNNTNTTTMQYTYNSTHTTAMPYTTTQTSTT